MNKTHYKGYKIYEAEKGYLHIWCNGKNTPLHVYVWEEVNGSKPDGYDIHHVDGNVKNYSLSNLELVSKIDHKRIHCGWVRNKQKQWVKKPCSGCKKVLALNKFYRVETRNSWNSICIECSKLKAIKNRRKPDYQTKHNTYVKRWRARRRIVPLL